MRRKTIGILLILGLVAGSGYATYLWANPAETSPPFDRVQFIEVQIVSAPVRHVRGQQEYTQDELRNVGYTVYPEERVRVISTRILRVDNTGRPQEFQGTSDGIEMLGSWESARARSDGRPGLILDGFQFRFPTTRWAISPSSSLMELSFAPRRTTLGREFATVATIAYQGEDKPTTFLRARWLQGPPKDTVVTLYDDDGASDKSADGRKDPVIRRTSP